MAKTQSKRIYGKAKNRARRTKELVHRNATALKLVMPGVSPQQSYGHQVNGASHSQILGMRRNIKGATHFGGTGACFTTSIAWLFGPTADPGVKIVCEQLDMWVTTWAKMDSNDRKETRRTWALAIGEFLMRKSASHTKGPIEATIAALIYLGWQPSAPDYWVLAKGTTVKLDGRVFTRFQILAKAQYDAQVILWREAAGHAHGGGLGSGIPNLEAAKRTVRYMKKHGFNDAAKAMDYLVVGVF